MKEKKQIHKSGENLVKYLHKIVWGILQISSQDYTTNFQKRSAATNLTERGVSFINLKRHGQWKSNSIVEGYIANSEPLGENEGCVLYKRILHLVLHPRNLKMKCERKKCSETVQWFIIAHSHFTCEIEKNEK